METIAFVNVSDGNDRFCDTILDGKNRLFDTISDGNNRFCDTIPAFEIPSQMDTIAYLSPSQMETIGFVTPFQMDTISLREVSVAVINGTHSQLSELRHVCFTCHSVSSTLVPEYYKYKRHNSVFVTLLHINLIKINSVTSMIHK